MVQDFPGVAFRQARVRLAARRKQRQIKMTAASAQCQKAGKEAEVNRVECEFEFTNGTGFRSFQLEREKRSTSEDFYLFRKLSGGMSCTI